MTSHSRPFTFDSAKEGDPLNVEDVITALRDPNVKACVLFFTRDLQNAEVISSGSLVECFRLCAGAAPAHAAQIKQALQLMASEAASGGKPN